MVCGPVDKIYGEREREEERETERDREREGVKLGSIVNE